MADPKQVATATRPYAQDVINNATLQDIAGLLNSLLDVSMAGIPEVFRHYEFKIDATHGRSKMVDSSVILTMPWIAVTVVNDGAVPVYIDINEKVNMREQVLPDGFKPDWYGALKPKESRRFDIKYSGIQRVYFTCEPGKSTTVRLYSESKRKSGKSMDLLDVIEGKLV